MLFFLNRYFSLFANVGVIFQSFRNWTPGVSVPFSRFFPLFVTEDLAVVFSNLIAVSTQPFFFTAPD